MEHLYITLAGLPGIAQAFTTVQPLPQEHPHNFDWFYFADQHFPNQHFTHHSAWRISIFQSALYPSQSANQRISKSAFYPCPNTEGHSFKTLRFFQVIRLCSHRFTFMLMTWKISSIFSTVIARIYDHPKIIEIHDMKFQQASRKTASSGYSWESPPYKWHWLYIDAEILLSIMQQQIKALNPFPNEHAH